MDLSSSSFVPIAAPFTVEQLLDQPVALPDPGVASSSGDAPRTGTAERSGAVAAQRSGGRREHTPEQRAVVRGVRAFLGWAEDDEAALARSAAAWRDSALQMAMRMVLDIRTMAALGTAVHDLVLLAPQEAGADVERWMVWVGRLPRLPLRRMGESAQRPLGEATVLRRMGWWAAEGLARELGVPGSGNGASDSALNPQRRSALQQVGVRLHNEHGRVLGAFLRAVSAPVPNGGAPEWPPEAITLVRQVAAWAPQVSDAERRGLDWMTVAPVVGAALRAQMPRDKSAPVAAALAEVERSVLLMVARLGGVIPAVGRKM